MINQLKWTIHSNTIQSWKYLINYAFFPISDENDVITRQRGCEIFKKMFLPFVKLNFRKSHQFTAKENHLSDFGEQKSDMRLY